MFLRVSLEHAATNILRNSQIELKLKQKPAKRKANRARNISTDLKKVVDLENFEGFVQLSEELVIFLISCEVQLWLGFAL